jgi:hypothetical protein
MMSRTPGYEDPLRRLLFCEPHACQRDTQFGLRALVLFVRTPARLFDPLPSLFDTDIAGRFRIVRKDDYVVIVHRTRRLQHAAGHEEHVPGVPRHHPHRTGDERRQKRNVSAQNPEFALGRSAYDHVGLALPHFFLWRDYGNVHLASPSTFRTSPLGKSSRNLLRLTFSFLDPTDHKESLLRKMVVLTFSKSLEALNRFFDRDELARDAGELLGDEEGL